MKIEIKQRKGQNSEEALVKALRILKKKTAGVIKILRERNRGFKKKSLIKHEKIREILHKRKLKKRRKKCQIK